MLAVAAAAAVWVDVQVYVDRDGDGRRGADEPPVPGAVVGAGAMEATADADGRARVQAVPGEPVWARGFDGFAVPGAWALPGADGGVVELGLVPQAPPRGPWTFVVAADSHMQRAGQPVGHEIDLANAMKQATAGAPTPRFVIVCGDMTQDSDLDEADVILHVFGASPAPLVPVMGNHDFYDDGVDWRARFGPDLYSFEVGGVHVMVLDSNRPVRELVAFARADLATVAPDQRVIAATHGPPEIELADALDGLGVELVLAGHWHVNRTLHRGRLVELDTEPWVMGGIDQTPGGYRVIEVTPPEVGVGRASLDARHYVTTETPVVSLVGPAPGQCAPPDRPVELIVAAAGGPELAPVRASIDGGPEIVLAPVGGWDWRGQGPALAAGLHSITLRAGRSKRDVTIEACAARFAPAEPGDWPQQGGGPGREGARAAPLGDRLAPRWVQAVGGELGAGAPVVAGGLVIVAPLDLADDRRSAVVALDLATGAPRWRFAPGAAVRNAVAADVDAGVVVAAASDGVVWGLDLATGAVRWRVDLGAGAGVWPEERAIWGAPLVAGGRAFVGGQRAFAAIDLRTGRVAWQVDPVPDADGSGSFSSPTLVGGTIVTIPSRVQGVQGWDAATGAPRWATIDTCSVSAAAAPVADGGLAHLVSGAGLRCVVDAATGDTGAWGSLDREGFEWAYEIAATPALGHGTLVAVTQFGEAFAFDLASEELRWARAVGAVAPIHAAHYRAATASLASSPVIAGDAAWIAGADGDVVAVDLATGRDRAVLHVGAPVLAGLAIAGDALVVASYDGTVRVYAPVRPPARRWPLAVDVVIVVAVYGGLALLARRRSRPRRRS